MYLKEQAYYTDLYDLVTIQECLDVMKFWQKRADENRAEGVSDRTIKAKTTGMFSELQLYCVKGERFKGKESAIRELMQKDRRRDEKLEQTPEPKNILCQGCARKMDVIFKDLHNWDMESLRVLFFFECPVCKKRKGVFEDGEHWVRQATKVEGGDDEDYDAELKQKRNEDRSLLQKYRAKFCLSDKDGEDYLQGCRNLEAVSEVIKSAERKRSDPDYKKAEQLKKLSIVELEKFLSDALEKQQFIKLVLDKPEIDRYVIVPFTVQDAISSRKEGDSQRKLQKAIKNTLEGTNWRLMSEGVSYRLGYLSGRLKGYEREEDLIQIVKQGKTV